MALTHSLLGRAEGAETEVSMQFDPRRMRERRDRDWCSPTSCCTLFEQAAIDSESIHENGTSFSVREFVAGRARSISVLSQSVSRRVDARRMQEAQLVFDCHLSPTHRQSSERGRHNVTRSKQRRSLRHHSSLSHSLSFPSSPRAILSMKPAIQLTKKERGEKQRQLVQSSTISRFGPMRSALARRTR